MGYVRKVLFVYLWESKFLKILESICTELFCNSGSWNYVLMSSSGNCKFEIRDLKIVNLEN